MTYSVEMQDRPYFSFADDRDLSQCRKTLIEHNGSWVSTKIWGTGGLKRAQLGTQAWLDCWLDILRCAKEVLDE